jgi:integrase
VDLKENVFHIRVQEEWRSKEKRDRTVPMHPKVAEILQKQRIGEHVFYGPHGGRIKESFCLQSLKRDRRKLGVVENDLH